MCARVLYTAQMIDLITFFTLCFFSFFFLLVHFPREKPSVDLFPSTHSF